MDMLFVGWSGFRFSGHHRKWRKNSKYFRQKESKSSTAWVNSSIVTAVFWNVKTKTMDYKVQPSGIRATLWNSSLTLAVAFHTRKRFLACCPPFPCIIAALNYGTPKYLSFAITFFAVASFSPNEMFLYRYLPPSPSLQAVSISHTINSLRPPIYQFISLWTNRRMKQSFTARWTSELLKTRIGLNISPPTPRENQTELISIPM